MKILDIGCGKHKIKGSIGVDIDLESHADIIHNLNKTPYPFSDGSVDKIFCFEVIEHLENYEVLLKEFQRILKKKGELIISTNNVNSLINRIFKTYEHRGLDPKSPGTHKHLFTIEEFRSLIEKNKFKIIKMEMLSFPCSYEHKILRKFLNPLRYSLNYFLPLSLRERMVVKAENIGR